MLDTVPGEVAAYDYGANYLRVFSTFIPRLFWPSKPLFGRAAWINAWMAGSELERADDFTGPAIGILGAAQLNGGAVGTVIVLAVRSRSLLRVAYEYFRRYAGCPLGAILLGDHFLQRLVHGRHRRPDGLVLLQLGVFDVSHRRAAVVGQQDGDAARSVGDRSRAATP